MRHWALRLFSIDGRRILLLASVVLLLAFGGVQLSQLVSANMLRTDAQSNVSAWAGGLAESADDIPAITSGAVPSPRTNHLLRDATQVGDIYRYKILDRTGHLVYLSERASYPSLANATADSPSKRIDEKVLSGGTFTVTGVGNLSDNPPHFAECYLPLKQNGAVIGILDISIDQTADHALYERSLLFTESIIAIAVLLAGGIPGFMVYRKMRDHRRAQAERSVSPLTLSRGRISTRSRTLVTKEPWKRDSAITHTPEFVRFGVEHREVVQ